MGFRVSDASIFQNAVRSTRQNRFALNQIQNQIATGKRINSLADDPLGASRSLGLSTTLDRIDQFQRNINGARAALQTSESAIAQVSDLLIRLRELAVSADTEVAEFDKIQAEAEQRFGELLSIANTRVGDVYLFGGFVTDTAPVTQTGVFTDPAPIVAYNGDSGARLVQIDESSQIQVNVTARELFFGSTDNDDVADGANVNVFSVIQDFINRLADPATNGAPVGVLDDLDSALQQTLRARGLLGARDNRVESTATQLDGLRVTIEKERSVLEDIDLVETITELQSKEATFQASLGITARIIQPTLLNFLG